MTATYTLTSTYTKARVMISDCDGMFGWDVFNDKRHIASGVTGADSLRDALTQIADQVTMPSNLAHIGLRGIASQPMPNHEQVPASALRTGDLLHVGGSNYILVATAEANGDTVRILAHGGTNPFTRAAEDLCNLSMRDASAE